MLKIYDVTYSFNKPMHYMEELKEQLIAEAQTKYKNIKPCKGDVFSDESFTTHNGKLVFWFNLENNSTVIIMSESHFHN